MSKEEPAWRAELREAVGEAVIAATCDGECGLSEDDCATDHPIRVAAWTFDKVSDIEAPVNWIAAVVDTALVSHITAAEQRGFQAGVNKTGDSVGKLREQLKAARAAHVEALKTDWSRYRGKVLHEVWEAMRDAEDGPLIDAMGVVNDLLAQS